MNWAGLVAFTLACGVSIGLAVTLIAIAFDPTPLDAAYSEVVTMLAASAVGALGAYLGFSRRDATPPPPPEAPHAEAEPDDAEPRP